MYLASLFITVPYSVSYLAFAITGRADRKLPIVMNSFRHLYSSWWWETVIKSGCADLLILCPGSSGGWYSWGSFMWSIPGPPSQDPVLPVGPPGNFPLRQHQHWTCSVFRQKQKG